MALFYRGAGVATYWHGRDARRVGFKPQNPGQHPTPRRLAMHIARGTVTSPYVSLTRSYGVAEDYAKFGRAQPTRERPAYIYEIELNEPLPTGLQLIDPVQFLANGFPPPTADISYHHDGDTSFLLGVVSPSRMGEFLGQRAKQPPPGEGTPRPPNLSMELEAMIRALRDSEVLAIGSIPAVHVRYRYEVC
jgi:hypothetical protein